jgi:hypothetical protein
VFGSAGVTAGMNKKSVTIMRQGLRLVCLLDLDIIVSSVPAASLADGKNF